MIVVSDSTPLIHIAKVELLDILFSLYEKILITREVYREVVEEGLVLEKDDARAVKEYIGKRIHVKDPISSSRHLVEKYFIHKGEAESIQLALDVNALLLINERDGRNAAKSERVKVKGTIGILFEAQRAGIINRGEVLRVFSMFRDNPQDFWMNPDMIGEAMKKLSLNE